jgi:hypothetical protein
MNAYKLEIVAELKSRQGDVERNYRAARNEWERLRIKHRNLLEADEFSLEAVDLGDSIRATFDYMMKLDDEANAIFACRRAIEQHA